MGIADEYTRFTLRIPESLHDALLKRARRNQRSLNGEIIAILDGVDQINEVRSREYSVASVDWQSKIESLSKGQQDALRVIVNSLVSE